MKPRDASFTALKDHVIDFTGLAYYGDKEDILADRLDKRCEATGASTYGAYLDLLQTPRGGKELEALAAELTIGETYFFRHEDHFQALRDTVFPQLIAKNQSRRQLRIWSACCSTGAETYSLSMLLKNDFARDLAGWNVEILGTDINRSFLAQAMEGRFEEWALRGVSEETRQRCFTKKGNRWWVAPEYRAGVSFEYHNLIKNHFPSLFQNLSAFDLILCRNAMIYFNRETNERLALQFHQTLVDEGWLIVGYAESDRRLFEAFDPVAISGAIFFQKRHVKEASQATPRVLAYCLPVLPPIQLPLLRESVSAVVPPVSDSPLVKIRQLADEGQWENALQVCRQYLDADRLNPELHYYAALVQEQLAHGEEAENLLRRALYLNRAYVLAHYHLGLLCIKRGKKSQAVKSFENTIGLLKHLPMNEMVAEADGISVGDLRSLAEMQLDILKGSPVP